MTRLRACVFSLVLAAAAGLLFGALVQPAGAADKKLSIAYMPHPIQEQQLKWMKKWGEQHGVDVRPTPISYEVYVEKLTGSFLARSQEYDVIWHNDDWGQLWGAFLEPVDDVKTIHAMDKKVLIDPAMLWPGPDGKKHATAVPLMETLGVFFYRKDLIKADEYPKTWADLVKISQRLQKDGKVKWGFVGGMKYPHTWFTLLWSFWTNDCDIFAPFNERDNEVLTKNGWKSMLGEKCAREAIEFWWDNINVHKISPPRAGELHADGGGRHLHGRGRVHDDERHPALRQVQRPGRLQGRRQGGHGEVPHRPQLDQEGRAGLAGRLVLGGAEGHRAGAEEAGQGPAQLAG